jgi:hypothetical protein
MRATPDADDAQTRPTSSCEFACTWQLSCMKARTIEGLFIVGLLDIAYRLLLREFVRARIGMETRASGPSA